ncbi:GMC family oxidoreductase [Neiella marina]|uniref:GMC family oxidoreductase n=1 Tax=Neiella holothuriorum TaxID=2870530 RepID=A0ABS7EGN6_9GAMM|nr:GMC family oxidoreductase [Neiella holothuriorum]MBW8191445.1 GMC family oxidoreductase [Neiella holothuriorum]
MSIDARFFSADQVETDICIVGSGPAGITLAREFIGQDFNVILLESGATDFDPSTQELASGEVIGDPLIAPVGVVNRQFGGLSNRWVLKIGDNQIGVRYAMFDEIDYQTRDCIPFSGWPFPRSSLSPYFERAQPICMAGPFDYEASSWVKDPAKELPFDCDTIETGMFQFGRRTAFYIDHKKELEQAENITIYHYANVVEARIDDTGKTISKVRVACLNGNQFEVSAKVVVLACGAYENARILLMSNQQQPHGLGNQHDVVGRYYHEHPCAIGGYFTPTDPEVFDRAGIYDLKKVNGTAVQGYLRLPKDVLEKEGISNINTLMFPCPDDRQMNALKAFKCLGENAWSIVKGAMSRGRKGSIPENFWNKLPGNLLDMLLGLDAVVKAVWLWLFKSQSLFLQFARGGGWSTLSNNRGRFERFEMRHVLEQSPHPDNRVTLSSECDALGCPKLQVHWRWHKDDADHLVRYVKYLSKQLAEQGLGQFDYKLDAEGCIDIIKPAGSHHLMGTTRMHDDPKFGVVDANCQVHGIKNLYIAGSSTFPTGGYANPTLTIVAMALRLADHIKQNVD